MNDVLRGVLFSLGGNIAISIGDHLKVFGNQDKSTGKKLYHGKTKKKLTLAFSKRFFCSLFGYILMLAGQICNGYALAFAPQTLLACIGSVQFIINLLCSALLMSRPITDTHICGTFSIIIGCLIIVFGFSPQTDTSQLSVYTLFHNFNSVHYRNYLVVVVFIFLFNIVWQYIATKYLTITTHSLTNIQSPKSHKKRLRKCKKSKGIQSQSFSQKSSHICCIDPQLISGFFYSFSSAMAGTQSVVLGKTLAIVLRNYYSGEIIIFNPLDWFILCFIIIVFCSFLITFAFWLYRRTESMVLFDTVFIAPLNQVMWLTFSTVAGGIYFHEFENANTVQWMALLAGMVCNYYGLYYLVPSDSDQPILVINMDKLPTDCESDSSERPMPKMSIKEKIAMQRRINRHNRKQSKKSKRRQISNDGLNKNSVVMKYYYDGIIDNDREHETDSCDDNECVPLIHKGNRE